MVAMCISHRSVQSVMLPLRRMAAATTCTAVPARRSSAGSVLDPGSRTAPAGEVVGGVSILLVKGLVHVLPSCRYHCNRYNEHDALAARSAQAVSHRTLPRQDSYHPPHCPPHTHIHPPSPHMTHIEIPGGTGEVPILLQSLHEPSEEL